MPIYLIVALDEANVIGREGDLPWKLSADLKRFKQLTWGHTLVMGRKTFQSIGRPLPGRRSIVVTRDKNFSAPGAEVAHSLQAALEMAGEGTTFVVGGGEIYRQTLALADKLYITRVHARVAGGDTSFPELDESRWERISCQRHEVDAQNAYPFSFEEYRHRTE